MKPPGWLVLDSKSRWTRSEDGRSIVMMARIRWWHPGFWIELAKTLWRGFR